MSSFFGADTAQVSALSDRFTTSAVRLDELMESVLGAVRSVEWEGPDADAFRDRAEGLHSSSRSVSDRVEQSGRRLAEEAEQQDQASEPATAPFSFPAPSGMAFPALPKDDLGDIAEKIAHAAAVAGAFASNAAVHLGRMADDVIEEALETCARVIDAAFVRNLTKAAKAMDALGKVAGAAGPVANGLEIIDALGKGDTATVIGRTYQTIFEISPFGRAVGTVDGLFGAVLPALPEAKIPGTNIDLTDQTPVGLAFDGMGRLYSESPSARAGERIGLDAADKLGVNSAWGRNAMKSGAGLLMHVSQRSMPTAIIDDAMAISNMVGNR